MKNDTKSIIQAKDIYFPKRSLSDAYLESVEEYCKRMKKILPNFPAEVLSQWFYRHTKLDINDYAWLDYRTITFFKEEWSSDLILSSGITNNKTVQIDKRKYLYIISKLNIRSNTNGCIFIHSRFPVRYT